MSIVLNSYTITVNPNSCDTKKTYVLTEKDIDTLKDYIKKQTYKKVCIVVEHAGKDNAHIHCAIVTTQTKKPFNMKQQLTNRYAKYINLCPNGYKYMVKVKRHPIHMINEYAGGYMGKENKHILNDGFTEEDLKDGQVAYDKLKKNQLRQKYRVVNIKNFFKLVDEFIFLNELQIPDTVRKFLYQIIKPMVQDKYGFTVGGHKMRELILQMIATDDTIEDWFNTIDTEPMTILVNKENYVKLVENLRYDLDN